MTTTLYFSLLLLLHVLYLYNVSLPENINTNLPFKTTEDTSFDMPHHMHLLRQKGPKVPLMVPTHWSQKDMFVPLFLRVFMVIIPLFLISKLFILGSM